MACGHLADAAAALRRLVKVRGDYPGLRQLNETVHEALGQHRTADACAWRARQHLDA